MSHTTVYTVREPLGGNLVKCGAGVIHTAQRSVSTCNETAADGLDNVINIDLIFLQLLGKPTLVDFPFYYSHNSCETVCLCVFIMLFTQS